MVYNKYMKKIKEKLDILAWLHANNQTHSSYDLIEINENYIEMFNDDINYQEFLKTAQRDGHIYLIHVRGDFILKNIEIKKLPVQFGIVDSFMCSDNHLTTLKGCPYYVNRHFFCSDNHLKSLEYAPRIVLGDFYCINNLLKELDNILLIKGSFLCYGNDVQNLIKFPNIIEGDVIFFNLSYIIGKKIMKYKDRISFKGSDLQFIQHKEFKFWRHFSIEDKAKDEQDVIVKNLNLKYSVKKVNKL